MPSRPSALQFPLRRDESPARHPLRVIQLVNGDRITAEVLEASPQAAVFRLFGQVRWRVPMTAVAGIAMRPQERQLLAVNNSEDYRPPDTALPLRWPIPQNDGELTCRFGWDVADDGKLHPLAWAAGFADGSRIVVAADASGRWRAERNPPTASPALQSVAVSDNRRPAFQIQNLSGRIYVSVAGQLLLADAQPAGALQSLETIPPQDAGKNQPASREMTYLTVMVKRPAAMAEFPAPRHDVDALVSIDGDVWWGRFERMGLQSVSWSAENETWDREWSDVAGVVFRTPAAPVAGRSIAGRIVRIELQPHADRSDLPGDRLTGALCGLTDGWLQIEHPLGGRLAIPWKLVRRVESLHVGVSHDLAAGTGSVGDKENDGTLIRLAGTFSLAHLPDEGAAIAVEISGLEPSGPQTPPGSPRLKSLRNGHGATEVYLNQQRIGTLNELTSRWTLPGEFETLRLAVPMKCLHAGDNAWSIRQQPGAGPRRQFDQSRLRAVSLEQPAGIPQIFAELFR